MNLPKENRNHNTNGPPIVIPNSMKNMVVVSTRGVNVKVISKKPNNSKIIVEINNKLKALTRKIYTRFIKIK